MTAAVIPPAMPSRQPLAAEDVPPLEQGDSLTRAEFHRRYSAMPNVKKAELIEGVVHMPSPIKYKRHAKPHSNIGHWLATYELSTPGTDWSSNASVFLDLSNELQPDALLRIAPGHGGQTKDTEDDYITGAPELVVEVASSSAAVDMNQKKRAYLRNGVREYLVWLTRENRVVWWTLKDSDYQPLASDEQGIVRSEVFPGLWLDTTALLAGDMAKVLAVLKQGLDSDQALAFRATLKSRI